MPWPSTLVATDDPVTAVQLNSMHVQLGEFVLASDTASVTFSNIPPTFDHLILVAHMHDSQTAANLSNVTLTCNGDVSARYGYTSRWNGALSGAESLLIGKTIGAAGSAGQNCFSVHHVVIPNYSSARLKIAAWRDAYSWDSVLGVAGTLRTDLGTSWWNSIDPIQTIRVQCSSAPGTLISRNTKAGARITLYATGAK